MPAVAGVKSRVPVTKLPDWPRDGTVAASVVKAEHTITTKDGMERACILERASVNVIWSECEKIRITSASVDCEMDVTSVTE